MLIEFHEFLHDTKIDQSRIQYVYKKLLKYHDDIQLLQQHLPIISPEMWTNWFFIKFSCCLFKTFGFIHYKKNAYQLTDTHKNCVASTTLAHIVGEMIKPLGYNITLGMMGIKGDEHICFGMGDVMCVYPNTLYIQLHPHVNITTFNTCINNINNMAQQHNISPSIDLSICHMTDNIHVYSNHMDICFVLMNMYLKWFLITNTSATPEIISEYYGKYYSFCYRWICKSTLDIKCNLKSIGSFYYMQNGKMTNGRRFDKFLMGVKYPDYSYNDMFIPFRTSLVFDAHRSSPSP